MFEINEQRIATRHSKIRESTSNLNKENNKRVLFTSAKYVRNSGFYEARDSSYMSS